MKSMAVPGAIFMIVGLGFIAMKRPLDAWNARTASRWERPTGADKTEQYGPYILGVGLLTSSIGLVLVVIGVS